MEAIFSVIIPTRGRPAELSRSIEALKRQPLALVLEIMVIFDQEHVDEEAVRRHPDLRCFATGGGKGPAYARNMGARYARGAYLLFLDDDVLVEDGAITSLARGLDGVMKPPALAAQIVPAANVPASLYVMFAYSDVAHSRFTGNSAEIDAWKFCSSFAVISRSVFNSAAGFNESFRRYEEVELALRLQAMGVRLLCCPTAVGHHLKIMDRAWFIDRGEVVGGYLRRLLDAHPSARRPPLRILGRLGFARPFLGLCWRISVKSLPLIERLPAMLSLSALRAVHALGLANGYLRQGPMK